MQYDPESWRLRLINGESDGWIDVDSPLRAEPACGGGVYRGPAELAADLRSAANC